MELWYLGAGPQVQSVEKSKEAPVDSKLLKGKK